jgi:hypothetical protein
LDEASRQKAQELIEDNLITANQRNTLSEAYIKKEFGIDDNLLQILEASSLLRKERDASGRLLYEISHDTLVEPIQKVAELRLKKEDDEKRMELEQQVQKERKRVRKARILSLLAIVTAVISIIALFIASRQTIKANNAKKQSDLSNAKTLETLKSLNYQKAQELYAKGNQFRDYQEYQLAVDAYDSAKNFLDSSKINQEKGKIAESDFIDLRQKISHQIDSLQKSNSVEK